MVVRILHAILKKTKKIMRNNVIRGKSRCFKKSTFLKQHKTVKIELPIIHVDLCLKRKKGTDSVDCVSKTENDKKSSSSKCAVFQSSVQTLQKKALLMKFYQEMSWNNTEMR